MFNKVLSGFGVMLLATVNTAAIAGQEIKGAGSAYMAPLFSTWNANYQKYSAGSGVVKYESMTAADGIKLIGDRKIDFGQTDMPLAVEELNKRGLFQFPVLLVAFTPIYNLPGIPTGALRLDGKVLGDIYLGKITHWNDAAIANLNSTLKLPDQKINLAYRVKGASGTYAFTAYVAKYNPEWREKIGVGLTVKWPTGHGVDTIKEMGEYIKNTPYSLAYTEFTYAHKNGTSYAQLKNLEGTFVKPSPDSVRYAAETAKWDANKGFVVDMIDQPGHGSWPMACVSYVLINKQTATPSTSKAMLHYFRWSMQSGGMIAVVAEFIPLPDKVFRLVKASWKTVLDNHGTPVY